MRKIAVFFLVILAAANMAAQQTHRNRIMYRPFDWQKIETPDNRYKIYFPKEMADKAVFVANELATMSALYRKNVFQVEYPVTSPDTSHSWLGNISVALGLIDTFKIVRDEKGNVITEKKDWQPKEIVIILFPNMQDYNQQKVVDVFIPPGVLGFTEQFSYRVAHPYGGNIHNLALVTAHELAHAWMFNFMAEWRTLAIKTKRRPTEDNAKEIKLWFIEGFAELLADKYLESVGQGNDYRRAEVNEFNMKSVVDDDLPNLSGPFETDGWANYSFGYHFLKFVAQRHSLSRFAELLELLAEGKQSFEEAWANVFGESLSTTELEWQKSAKFQYHRASLFADADNLEKKRLVMPFALYGISYDAASNQIVGYEQDEKWELRTVVVNLDSLQSLRKRQQELAGEEIDLYELRFKQFTGERADSLDGLRNEKVETLEKETQKNKDLIERLADKTVVPIHHQFKDKSLFYRLDNRPAIKGRRVALAVSEGGQDVLNVFEIDLGGKEPKTQLLYEISFPDILWFNDLSFASDNELLFVGMNKAGEKNIYSLTLSEKKISKLTDSPNEKFSPQRMVGSTFFIEADSSDRRQLYEQKGDKIYRVGFTENGFVDQLVTLDSLAIVRVLNRDGNPEIFIWPYGAKKAYRYRYGSTIQTEQGIKSVGYPLPHYLVGLTRNNELIVGDSESRTGGRYVLKAVALDYNRLEMKEVSIEEKPLQKPVQTAMSSKPYTIKEADKSLRFPSIFRDGFYGNGYRMGMANATGEYAFSGMLYGSYDSYFGFIYFADFNYYNFSERLQSLTNLSMGRFYRFRNDIFINHDKDESGGLILDEQVEARRMYLWPFDLENSVSFGLGIGYLRREYLPLNKFDNEETKVLRTPFYKLMGQFVSDGAFVDDLRSSRHGHFLQMRGEFSGDKEVLAFDGSATIDYRYYFRPWQASPYFASRIVAGKAFGRDATWFFLPDLYRKPGFQEYDFSKSFGDEFLMYQLEFRLPLMRWILFNYKFWNNPAPFFLISVNAHAFLYGGDIRWQNEDFHFAHRAGYGLKFGLGFWPIYIKWERYSYLNQGNENENFFGRLFGKWQNAWTIEMEY